MTLLVHTLTPKTIVPLHVLLLLSQPLQLVTSPLKVRREVRDKWQDAKGKEEAILTRKGYLPVFGGSVFVGEQRHVQRRVTALKRVELE
jgi:hypothetical protein